MNLQRCSIKGFGKLCDLDLCFHAGLNLVFAPNEAGKSTLQQFLLGLLFGPLRDDVPNQRRAEPWVDRFKPWRHPEYGGILSCRLAGGREVEVYRTFGKEDPEIRTVAGEDITDRYERRKNGDILFARRHLGISKGLFDSLAVIRENKVSDLHSPDGIGNRIANLVQTGDEDLSILRSLERLGHALEELGSDRAPTRPFRSAQDRVRALQDERGALEARRAECQKWIQERHGLEEEIERLKREAQGAALMLTAARRGETAQRVRELERVEAELQELRREMEDLACYANVPADCLDDLNRLVAERDMVERRLEDVRAALSQARDQLRSAQTAREALIACSRLDSEAEEKLTERLVHFKDLSAQQKEVERAMARNEEERRAGEEELRRLGSIFAEADWQARVHEANEKERAANQRYMGLAEAMSHKNTALSEVRRTAARARAWGALCLALALLAGIGALILLGADGVAPAGAAALALAAAGLLLLRRASISRGSVRQIQLEAEDLRGEQEHVKSEGQRAHFEIGVAMHSGGYRGLDEFLSAARRADQLQRRSGELEKSFQELKLRQERISSESLELYQKLKGSLERTGLPCSPETLEASVLELRENLRCFSRVDQVYRGLTGTLDSILKDEATLTEEWNHKEARIRSILAKGKWGSVESFREACQRHRSFLSLREREGSLLREREGRSGHRTLEEWKERLRVLDGQLPQPARDAEGIPDVEQAERQEKQLAAVLAATGLEHARLAERIHQAFGNHRTLSEIEEDLAQAERELREITKNRRALEIAAQMLEDLAREQQESLAPQLNRAVEQRFLRLCGRRYEEVKIDPDFRIWVRESGTGALRSAELLSQGAQDQLYFALRFGILELVSNSEEPCPCLLDEPFAAYDRARLEEAFKILEEEAQRRQIVVFTCRDDLRDRACAHSAHLIELPA